MAQARIMPGICGLETVVQVCMTDSDTAEIQTATACDLVRSALEDLRSVTAVEAISSDCVAAACRRAGMHPACPVPCAVVKAIEVAAGLALPGSVRIDITP
ncbi:MAG: DUF6951 family protein [Armatimonadota bacterium]